jgi:hypothetical protein
MSLKFRLGRSVRALTECWRSHSLSITFLCGGSSLVAVAIPFREGTVFDIVSGLGLAALTAGLYNFAAGPLREVNKPEEDNGSEQQDES